MTENKQNIDPNTYTSEELLKLVYRQIQEINKKLDDIHSEKRDQDKTIQQQSIAIKEIQARITEKEKSFKAALTIASLALSILSMLTGFVTWMLSR